MGCINSAEESTAEDQLPSNKQFFLQGSSMASATPSSPIMSPQRPTNSRSQNYQSATNDQIDEGDLHNNGASLLGGNNKNEQKVA